MLAISVKMDQENLHKIAQEQSWLGGLLGVDGRAQEA
jgi:hypothetical protein